MITHGRGYLFGIDDSPEDAACSYTEVQSEDYLGLLVAEDGEK